MSRRVFSVVFIYSNKNHLNATYSVCLHLFLELQDTYT